MRSPLLVSYRKPSLDHHLDRVPRAAQWRRIAEIEIVELIDAEILRESGRHDVDPFGHLAAPRAQDRCALILHRVIPGRQRGGERMTIYLREET